MIQDIICDEDIKRLLEESKNWYGYIPKGFIKGKLERFIEDLKGGIK